MTVSLRAMLEEVDYELGQRRRVYRRLDATDPRHRAHREMHMQRMEAVRETLEQLERTHGSGPLVARAASSR